MSTSVNGVSQQDKYDANTNQAFNKVDLDDFIKMLVAELQNQDPMSPMDNSQLLQQVSQIKAIQSNDQLTTTLQSVLLGQNVATAGNLIGQTVTGLTDAGDKVTGKVDSVSIEEGIAKLHMGTNTVTISNVAEILPTSSS
jgi:flagellar hook assembly protein FlgD